MSSTLTDMRQRYKQRNPSELYRANTDKYLSKLEKEEKNKVCQVFLPTFGHSIVEYNLQYDNIMLERQSSKQLALIRANLTADRSREDSLQKNFKLKKRQKEELLDRVVAMKIRWLKPKSGPWQEKNNEEALKALEALEVGGNFITQKV